MEMVDAPVSGVYLLDSRPLRIQLGRPAVVGIDRGRGALQSLAPACQVTSKLLTMLFGCCAKIKA